MGNKELLRKLANELLDVYLKYNKRGDLNESGKMMFRLFTQSGMPPDMFFDSLKEKMNYNNEELLYILSVYQSEFIEHKIKSGINEKNLKRNQDNNVKVIESFLKTGETGIF